ncbi:hypothetical protein GCM10020221_34850 [Streptomyces thioluteus]|uniref:Glucosamine/galactosamine-6-phosphate isomerase domain-containing protein n=1 Tax=Streptomyces thioluteus TaxID=66431 RepID=A0ABN3X371_STRTU
MDAAGGPRLGLRRPHEAGGNGNGCCAASPPRPPGRGRLVAADLWWRRGSSPTATPSATSRRPARPCWTRSGSTRRGCTPCPRGRHVRDADEAAEAYAAQLAAAAQPEDHAAVPSFDVLLLGRGPDTHVASLFPSLPGVRETERTVIGVTRRTQAPPTRISLTLPAIARPGRSGCWRRARTRRGRSPSRWAARGEIQAPAAGAYGRTRTLWLLDSGGRPAPRDLYPPASP